MLCNPAHPGQNASRQAEVKASNPGRLPGLPPNARLCTIDHCEMLRKSNAKLQASEQRCPGPTSRPNFSQRTDEIVHWYEIRAYRGGICGVKGFIRFCGVSSRRHFGNKTPSNSQNVSDLDSLPGRYIGARLPPQTPLCPVTGCDHLPYMAMTSPATFSCPTPCHRPIQSRRCVPDTIEV